MKGVIHWWTCWLALVVACDVMAAPHQRVSLPDAKYWTYPMQTQQGNWYSLHITWFEEDAQLRTAHLVIVPETLGRVEFFERGKDSVVPQPGRISVGRTLLYNSMKRVPVTEKHFLFLYTRDRKLKPIEGLSQEHLRYWDGGEANQQMTRVKWWAEKIDPLIDKQCEPEDESVTEAP